MSLRFGLSENTVQKICAVLAKHPQVESAVVYGSRAKGNYKPGSDIDLTLRGDALKYKDLTAISDELDDLLLPYTIDLSIFDMLEHAKLREHIERVGKVLYQRVTLTSSGVVMGAGWQVKILGDVCQTGSGGTPLKSKKEFYENGTIPWLMSGEVSQGEVMHATNFITKKGLENSSARIFPKNTVLVAMYGATAGETGILRFESATNQAVCGILPNDHFVPEFLFYCLLSKKDELVAQAAGNAQPNISQIKIRSTEIPVPPLPEQQRIVAILDEAFAGIATAAANAKKNLANARELFESTLQSVFTDKGDDWEVKRVGDLAKTSLGKMLDKAKNRGDLKPYLRNLNVRWFKFDLSDMLEMRFLAEEHEKYTAVKGDVLICEGGYPGRAAIWEQDYPIHFQKAIHRVRFHQPEYNKWFLYFLCLSDINKSLKNYFTGAGIQHFTGQALNGFLMPVAPLPEMKTIVTKLDELSTETKKLEAIYQQKLLALEELKKAILNQAFSGQLS